MPGPSRFTATRSCRSSKAIAKKAWKAASTSGKAVTSSHQELLGGLLKQVSRSFYLTLAVLPASLRPQLGLAYLFARAADTIADTDVIDRSRRLDLLRTFKAQFAGDAPDA